MKQAMSLSVLLVLTGIGAPQVVCAAEPCAVRNRVAVVSRATDRSVSQIDGLTIAPFAIPVAVPVATVQRPTLFYSYSLYAEESAGAPLQSATDKQTAAAVPTESDPQATAGSKQQVADRVAAARILTQHCLACHRPPATKSGLELFDEQDQLRSQLRRQAVLEMISPTDAGPARMPPGERPKLTPEEVEIIRRWAAPPRELVY